MSTCWVGIDEAGYGPNLGPLVMSAVVAVGPDERPPDPWADLGPAVARAGGDPSALWIDDSKALYRPGQGRDRLEAACLALVAATHPSRRPPGTLTQLLDRIGAGTIETVGLTPWLSARDPVLPSDPLAGKRLEPALTANPFDRATWRLVAVRSVVNGPTEFNALLASHGENKARVHFQAFARLLRSAWELAPNKATTRVRGDKHGGRHFYYEPLIDAFADAWIDRGVEGPEQSCYVVRQAGRRLELRLTPRADADDGLVALASVVSKALREYWMDAFNAFWIERLPGLRPTAGYPVDAARFRRAIEAESRALGLSPDQWWRRK
ncbi:MAG: hypothetical protein U0794_10105 [Isosphaeraceae bacterium]